MTDSNQNIQQSDEITLKELILLIKEYWGVLWGKKWYIVIAGLIGGLIFGIIEYRKPVTYTAELTFMVNEDEGGGLGGAASILGQFGLSGASSSEYNLDKIVQLSKSRRISQNVLFDSIRINNEIKELGNYIIELYDYHGDKWSDIEPLKKFTFQRNLNDRNLLLEEIATKSLFFHLVGNKDINGLMSCGYNEQTGVLFISSRTLSEELSLTICNEIYEDLSTFYINQSIEKQNTTIRVLRTKADSISTVLERKELLLARQIDNSQGFSLKTAKLKEQELERDVQILAISYGEILKNLATAEFLLETAKPFFQVIDRPTYPLDPSQKRYSLNILIGVLIGGLMSSLFVIINYYFKKILS